MLFTALILLDIVVSFLLVGLHYDWAFLSWKVIGIAIIYLIGKGFLFRDMFSIMDALIGIYMLIIWIAGGGVFLTWVFLVYFIYKLGISFA